MDKPEKTKTYTSLPDDPNLEPNDNNEYMPNSIERATIDGDRAAIENYFEKNENEINLQNINVSTALRLAAREGHEVIVKLLLEKGADPNIQNKYGDTALLWSIYDRYEGIVKLLLDNGASINVRNNQGSNALILAASKGHEGIVKLLLERGADPNIVTKNGQNALMIAAFRGYEGIVKLLLERGADPNIVTKYGETALYWAVENGHKNIVKMLLDHNKLIDEKSAASPLVQDLIREGLEKDIKSRETDKNFLFYYARYKSILEKREAFEKDLSDKAEKAPWYDFITPLVYRYHKYLSSDRASKMSTLLDKSYNSHLSKIGTENDLKTPLLSDSKREESSERSEYKPPEITATKSPTKTPNLFEGLNLKVSEQAPNKTESLIDLERFNKQDKHAEQPQKPTSSERIMDFLTINPTNITSQPSTQQEPDFLTGGETTKRSSQFLREEQHTTTHSPVPSVPNNTPNNKPSGISTEDDKAYEIEKKLLGEFAPPAKKVGGR